MMFRCVPYNESMRDEWDCFVLNRGTIFHTISFRQILLQTFGYTCCYHAIVDTKLRICAVIPLVTGRNIGLKQAGVSLPFVNYVDICADSEEALQYALRSVEELQRNCHLDYIELRFKEQDINRMGWKKNLQHHTFVLPLAADEDQILALSTASNRNHVRKVYKKDWFTVSFDTKHLQSFYHVYCTRMKQLGSPAPDIQFFLHFFQYLPDNTFLLTVTDKETEAVVGGMLLLTSPGNQTLYYPYGANLIEYNNKYLNNFMYWEAVRFGIRQGMKHMDFGRSQTGSGTYKYKQQWGATAEQLKYLVYDGGKASSGSPDKEKLHVCVELWKQMPRFITDPVGKLLIKYIMP